MDSHINEEDMILKSDIETITDTQCWLRYSTQIT